MPLHGSYFVLHLLGPAGTRKTGVEGYIPRTISSVLQVNDLKGSNYRFSGKAGLTSLDRDGRAASTGREDSAEFRGSLPPVLLGSVHMSPFQCSGSHLFPINALTLTEDTL